MDMASKCAGAMVCGIRDKHEHLATTEKYVTITVASIHIIAWCMSIDIWHTTAMARKRIYGIQR